MHGVCHDMPNDPVLGPALRGLEPRLVLEALRGQVADAPREIVALDASYHPGRYVGMAFALLPDASIPVERAWPEGDLVYVHAPVRRPVSRRGQVLRVGELEAEVYRFPDDRRLRGLRKFASTRFAPHIWQTWLTRSGSRETLDPATLQRRLIRYVPEQKWIVRLRAEVSVPGTTETTKRRIAVRCAAPSACQRLALRHAVVGKALADVDDSVRVPEVIGLEKGLGVLGVEWDRGAPLFEVWRDDGGAIDSFAAALSRFHAARVADLPTLTPHDIGASVAAMVGELSLACADDAGALRSLRDEVVAGLDGLDPVEPVTLHNDLHLRQVLVKRRRMTFLDLERMARGDPLIDVANLAAQITILPHRAGDDVTLQQAAKWRAMFLAGWSRSNGDEIDERGLGLFVAASLIKLAHGAMRHLRPAWREIVGTCVRLAERELAAGRRRAEVR